MSDKNKGAEAKKPGEDGGPLRTYEVRCKGENPLTVKAHGYRLEEYGILSFYREGRVVLSLGAGKAHQASIQEVGAENVAA